MATSVYTKRLHALEFAIASSSPDDSPQDIVCRAQIYTDWLTGVFTVPLEYQTEPSATLAAVENVVPMKPKG